MKVIVGGYVWIRYADIPDHVDRIRRALTVWPRKTSELGDDIKPIHLFRNSKEHLGVPRAFYLENKVKNNTEVLRVSDGTPIDVATRFTASGPFAEQAECIETCLDRIRSSDFGGFLIQAGCGWGKSSVALELARRMGRRTLIIVHKEFLLRQWQARIRLLMPSATVGTIQQDSFDLESDFVVGMVHSLSKGLHSYPKELFDSFGTVISGNKPLSRIRSHASVGQPKTQEF